MPISIAVPHAIIFLYDRFNPDVSVPEYIDNELVAFNSTCISIGTQAEVDGDVRLDLLNEIKESEKESFIHIFSGILDTPTKNVSLSTSESEGIIDINVSGEQARINVWVDDVNYPGAVYIEAI